MNLHYIAGKVSIGKAKTHTFLFLRQTHLTEQSNDALCYSILRCGVCAGVPPRFDVAAGSGEEPEALEISA
jgi:hypothetical protein